MIQDTYEQAQFIDLQFLESQNKPKIISVWSQQGNI